jgi:hypothetical protein
MKQPKTIDDVLDGWIGDLARDGTVDKWKREQNLKTKKKGLRRLTRTISRWKEVTEIYEEMYPARKKGINK